MRISYRPEPSTTLNILDRDLSNKKTHIMRIFVLEFC